MNTLKNRQMQVLKRLYYSIAPIPAEDLCIMYDVSLRTIRYDLREIRVFLEKIDVELVVRTGAGYSIKNSDKTKLLLLFDKDVEKDAKDERGQRKEAIIFELSTTSHSLSLIHFSNLLFLSESSISKCIQVMNHDLGLHGINIASTSKGYALVGDETEIRLHLVDRIQNIITKHYNLLDYYDVLPKAIRRLISKERYKRIMVGIERMNQLHHVWLSEQMFLRFVAFVVVSDMRIEMGKFVSGRTTLNPEVFEAEKDYVEGLFSTLYDVYSTHEIEAYIAFLISEGIFVHSKGSEQRNITDKLVLEIVQYLKSKALAIDYDTLTEDLKKHMSVSMKRHYANLTKDKNPLLNQIKQQHEVHYQLALVINDSVIQKSRHHYELDEDELSYLAIYLYKNSLKKPQFETARVYVACASSRGVSKLLETRIKHVFPQIEVLGTLSIDQVMQKKNFDDADFIISTIPVINTAIPVLHVTQLLNVKDIDQIQRILNYGASSRVIPDTTKSSLNEFIRKQFEAYGADTFVSVEKLSKIILSLIDSLVSLDDSYRVTDQKVLGILIHVILAIPRWIDTHEMRDDYADGLLRKIHQDHSNVYHEMSQFFELVEAELSVLLSSQERLSFFDYIIERSVEHETGNS